MKRVSALLPKRKLLAAPKQQFKSFATASSTSTSTSFLGDETLPGQQFKVQRLPQKHVEKWLDFETIVHAPHGISRTHFSNRWWNDPSRDPNNVFVIYDPQNPKNIISSLRVYDRHMYLNKQKVKFGGIGHVATHPEFQAKGLATSLLMEASKFLEEELYDVSGVFSMNSDLYDSLGWKDIPLEYTQVQGAFYTQTYVNRQYKNISRPEWGNEDLARQFCKLYDEYNLHYGFNGTLARDNHEYWMHWVAKEAYALNGFPLIMMRDGKLRAFFIAYCHPVHQAPFTVESAGGQTVQYSPTHHHVGSFFEFLVTVQEFVIAKEDHNNAMEIFLEFLHALVHKLPALEQTTKRELFFTINIHSPIAEQVLKLDKEHCKQAPFMVETSHKKQVHGSRYKLVSHGASSVDRVMFEQDMRHNHLFFKTDQF